MVVFASFLDIANERDNNDQTLRTRAVITIMESTNGAQAMDLEQDDKVGY